MNPRIEQLRRAMLDVAAADIGFLRGHAVRLHALYGAACESVGLEPLADAKGADGASTCAYVAVLRSGMMMRLARLIPALPGPVDDVLDTLREQLGVRGSVADCAAEQAALISAALLVDRAADPVALALDRDPDSLLQRFKSYIDRGAERN